MKEKDKQHVQFILRVEPTSCHMNFHLHPDDHNLVTQPYGVAGDAEKCHLCFRRPCAKQKTLLLGRKRDQMFRDN